MVVKHVLFRSVSGPLSKAADDQPSTSDKVVAKSFTYGSLDSRATSSSAELETEDDLTGLLEIAETSGTCQELVAMVASTLESNVERNELHDQLTTSTVGGQHMLPTGRLTVFHGLRPPPISLPSYLERLAKYTKCSPVCFVMAAAYMDMLAQRDPDFMPTTVSVHRLILTGVMLAAKLTDDHYFNNAFFARVGGVSLQELNKLELEMMKQLDMKMLIPLEVMYGYLQQLKADTLLFGSGDQGNLGRKRRSASGNSGERRTHRRGSMDSSLGGLSTSASQHYDEGEDDDFDKEEHGAPSSRSTGENVQWVF